MIDSSPETKQPRGRGGGASIVPLKTGRDR